MMKFKRKLLKMGARFTITGGVLYAYFFDKAALDAVLNFPANRAFSLVHLVWLFILADTVCNFIPILNRHTGSGKLYKRFFAAWESNKDTGALQTATKTAFQKSLFVMLIWVAGNAALCLCLGKYELIVLSALYFSADMVCILLFCPFQRFIMKSKCCRTCTLYWWGYVMFATPLFATGCFFGLSLFFVSLSLFIFGEYQKIKHPERFFEHSNRFLTCGQCKKSFCKIKKPMY